MARTYGLIGTRPDLGGLLARAQLEALWSPREERTAWGLGLFEKDEVLLRRGPGGSDSQLLAHVGRRRSHAFLAHECDIRFESPSTENLPPLRYGHVLFSCQGLVADAGLLMGPMRVLIPESLMRSVRGETFTEIAFALFLAELPKESLARTRLTEPRRSADPIRPEILKKALRGALKTLDELCKKQGLSKFLGDLWIHTGEILMIAHREGTLALQVTRGRVDLQRWQALGEPSAPGLEQSHFVALSAGSELPPPDWERLPHGVLLTAKRGEMPQAESL